MVCGIPEEKQSNSVFAHLDRFQFMKLGRVRALLVELEKMKQVHTDKWLSYIALRYGIRRATGIEYIREFEDGGYIKIENDNIIFVKKLEF